MDVFNSALRNPLPPLRKDLDKHPDHIQNHNLPPNPSSPSNNPLMHPSYSSNVSSMTPSNNHSANTSGSEDIPDLEPSRKKKSSRRKHRNSHLGCGTCKKRRIKCDENLPQCFNCVKGKLHCAYLNLDLPSRNALRMAQYNQNLRHDRPDDQSLLYSDKDSDNIEILHVHPHLQYHHPPNRHLHHLPMNPHQPPSSGMMPFHPSHHPVPSPMTNSNPPPHQPLLQNPPPATIIQSPYGPLVSFQPMNSLQPSPYSPVAVQMIPSQVPPNMLYHTLLLAQHDLRLHHIPGHYPGQPAAAPHMLLHHLSPSAEVAAHDASMVPPSHPPTAFVTANTSPTVPMASNPSQPQQPLHYSLMQLPKNPDSASPVHPSFTPPSAEANFVNGSVQQDPTAAFPDPSAQEMPKGHHGLKSPLLMALPTSSLGADHSVKLLPLNNKNDSPDSSSGVPMLQGSDKVPSILKLLS